MNIKDSDAADTDGAGAGTPDKKSPSFWRAMVSVAQASFGVQNSANRERDFSESTILPFVVAALIFTALFVVTLMVIVSLVI